MNEVFVPEAKFQEMDRKSSVQSLSEKGSCQTFYWENCEYVVTGAMGNGTGRGWQLIWANEVVDLSSYKGELKPMDRGEHHKEVDKGNRERGYMGQIATSGKRTLVFVSQQITFKPLEVGKQLTIF